MPVNRAALSQERLGNLAKDLPTFETLAEVIAWSTSLTPPRMVADVIVQDEFTHDVVLPWRDALVLVFGTT